MNQDFRVSVGFLHHRKTIKLRRILKDRGLIGLIGLWSHAAAHNWSGTLDGYTPKDIADAAGWKGSSSKFVDALVECGFLDAMSNGIGYVIHDWQFWNDYATKAPERINRAKKAAHARHHADEPMLAKSNATSIDYATCPLPPDSPEITTRYKRISGDRI